MKVTVRKRTPGFTRSEHLPQAPHEPTPEADLPVKLDLADLEREMAL